MKKRIMLLRYVTQVGKCVVGLFKKKSCGASLCKSEIAFTIYLNGEEIQKMISYHQERNLKTHLS